MYMLIKTVKIEDIRALNMSVEDWMLCRNDRTEFRDIKSGADLFVLDTLMLVKSDDSDYVVGLFNGILDVVDIYENMYMAVSHFDKIGTTDVVCMNRSVIGTNLKYLRNEKLKFHNLFKTPKLEYSDMFGTDNDIKNPDFRKISSETPRKCELIKDILQDQNHMADILGQVKTKKYTESSLIVMSNEELLDVYSTILNNIDLFDCISEILDYQKVILEDRPWEKMKTVDNLIDMDLADLCDIREEYKQWSFDIQHCQKAEKRRASSGVFSDLSPNSPTFGDIAFATDDVFDFGLNNPKTYLRQDSFIDEGFNDIFDVVDNKVTFSTFRGSLKNTKVLQTM